MAKIELLDRLIGQERVKNFLKEIVKKRKPGAYLFMGPSGVGKRTGPILFDSAINDGKEEILYLSNPDVRVFFPKKKEEPYEERLSLYKIDSIAPLPSSGEEIHIETIREIKQEMAYPPVTLEFRIYIILHADRMRIESSNAFLKTLEEPGKNTIFILTTSRPFYIPSTIRSRCQIIRFNSIPEEEMSKFLKEKGFKEEEIEKALLVSQGSLKEAFSYLKNPEGYFSKTALNIFGEAPLPDHLIVDYAELLRDDLDRFVNTLLFLYTSILRFKKTKRLSPVGQDIIEKKAQEIPEEKIIEIILFIEQYKERLFYNPNRRLFLLTLLSKLV